MMLFLYLQEKFGAEQTVVELAGLLPATDYSVTLYALYEEEPSDPVTAVTTTCETLSKQSKTGFFTFTYTVSLGFPILTFLLLHRSALYHCFLC